MNDLPVTFNAAFGQSRYLCTMKKAQLQASTFEFLKQLKKNNNREWFARNKERYLKELSLVEDFAGELFSEMNKHDAVEPGGRKIVFRIYRDIRFSEDKTPYKTHFSGSFKRATKARRGGYYFHLEPGNSFAAGGFWGPNPEDLRRIRDELSFDPQPLRKILKSKSFVENFGKLEGEQIKTTPKGFDPDDAAIDLLRYKQFEMIRKYSDKEVMSDGFVKKLSDTFRKMRPFLDYMTEVLTTDINGESVI
jgi:uncharacterized protein (TIGR02453 family)